MVLMRKMSQLGLSGFFSSELGQASELSAEARIGARVGIFSWEHAAGDVSLRDSRLDSPGF